MEKVLTRTFIAIEIPDGIKAAMNDVQSVLRKSGADVSWVRPEGIHLTLKFLGPVEATVIEGLKKSSDAAVKGIRPFTLGVKGIGVFPAPKAPRVVWVGLTGDTDTLMRLYNQVEDACEAMGFKREARPFKPHLTLGRVKSSEGRSALMGAVDASGNVELGSISAGSVSIMKSELRPSGAVYTELHRALFPRQ